MLAVFRDAGYAPTTALEDGVVRLEFVTSADRRELARHGAPRAPGRGALGRAAARPRRPSPSSGPAGTPGRSGPRSCATWSTAGSPGGSTRSTRTPPRRVARRADVRLRREDIGEPVDLAVVACPAETVLEVVADCATQGRARARRGLARASPRRATRAASGRRRSCGSARTGMRVIGPNCLGVINTDPALRLNASLSPVMPRQGPDRLLLPVRRARDRAARDGGPRAVSGCRRSSPPATAPTSAATTCCSTGRTTRHTDVLLLYLESIGNPRKFTRIARRTSRTKPIVAVKSGRSRQGIPLGHRVRSTALPPTAVDEMFRQSGVIQVDTLSRAVRRRELLSFQPLPAGRRVPSSATPTRWRCSPRTRAPASELERGGDVRVTVAPSTRAATFGRCSLRGARRPRRRRGASCCSCPGQRLGRGLHP